MMKRSHLVGLAFFGLQIFAIVYARFIPERFFSWAPYDEHSRYTITAEIDGKVLSRVETKNRYRYDSDNWEVRSIHNVISLVRQYEQTYGQADNATVTIRFKVNGRPEEQWIWPSN